MEEDRKFAPVVIPTLCRYEHFRRCIESLARCKYADKTELIIGLDYPLKESHVEGYRKIKEYLESGIEGYGKLTVIMHTKNQGGVQNYQHILKKAFNRYDRVIVSEDDNEFAPDFLDYVNKGLDRYEDSPEVVAICGYNYPINMEDYPDTSYLSHNYSAWGCGLWRSKNERYLNTMTLDRCKRLLRNPGAVIKILRIKPTLLISLWHMIRKNTLLGDVNREIYNIVDNHYCLFPRLSMVRNWGHDGSGINCGDANNDLYLRQDIDCSQEFDMSGEVRILPPTYNKRLRKFFGDRPYDLVLRTCRYIRKHLCK